MFDELQYIKLMKSKIIDAINKNEFDKYLMGEDDYIVSSRSIPTPVPGIGNLYSFMLIALIELQNTNKSYDLKIILMNGIKQLIYKNPYGLLNAVEIIRSIINSNSMKSLGITKEDLKALAEEITIEAIRIKQELKDTISPLNSKMSIYDCLEFYNDYMYENIGRKLI